MSKKTKVEWICPECGYHHHWKWAKVVPDDSIWMACGECGYEFNSRITKKGKVHLYTGIDGKPIKQLTDIRAITYEC